MCAALSRCSGKKRSVAGTGEARAVACFRVRRSDRETLPCRFRHYTSLPLHLVDIVEVDHSIIGSDHGMLSITDINRAVFAGVGDKFAINFQGPAAMCDARSRATADIDFDHIRPFSAIATIDPGIATHITEDE